MAITYIRQQAQTQQSGGSATTAVNLGATLVAGNVIVVWSFASGDTLASMSAVTGITWTLGATGLNAASNAAVGLAVGVCTADVSSGTTITANLATAGSTRRGLVIDEFSGVDNTTPLQTSAVSSGTAAVAAAPSITTTGTGLLLVSANCQNNATSSITDMLPPTSPATFTETIDQNIGTTPKRMTAAYLLAASAGTYSPTHTVGTGTQAAAEGGAGALNPAAAILATPFDELVTMSVTTGPWTMGPIVFYEPRDELIFIPVTVADQTVSPPVATATASAPTPTLQISISAPAATATASSPTPGLNISIVTPAATATASSPAPTPAVSIAAPVATAAASSPVPVPQIRVSPAAATASASAPTPTILAPTLVVPVATASANSPPPIPDVRILAPAATASASAPVPIVTTGAVVTVPVATATASAPVPTLQVSVAAPVGTATASAPTPTLQLRLSPPAATAAATSPAPTPQLRVSPAAATAAANAPAATPQLRLSPGAATASASAPIPTVTVGGVGSAATTQALYGYVTGTPGSGVVTPTGAAGLVIVGSTANPGQTGASGIPIAGYAPQDVCVLGYSNQNLGSTDVAAMEALIGRTFTGLRQNQAYTTTGISGAAGAIAQYDAGRTTSYRSIQFDTLPGGWAAAATGAADTQLTTFCTNVINAARWTTQNPFLVCLHHEASNSLGGVGSGFTAADYKAMWAHCVPVMLATGAPLAFAYVGWDRMFVGANGIGPPTAGQGVDDFDPGSSLYTYIGSDVYNPVDSPGVLRYGLYAATLVDAIRTAAITRGKDWIIGEMGCSDGATAADHTNKAFWMDSLRVYLDGCSTVSPGVCRVLLTTIKTDTDLNNVDSSAESIAAWQRLGGDVYYK